MTFIGTAAVPRLVPTRACARSPSAPAFWSAYRVELEAFREAATKPPMLATLVGAGE